VNTAKQKYFELAVLTLIAGLLAVGFVAGQHEDAGSHDPYCAVCKVIAQLSFLTIVIVCSLVLPTRPVSAQRKDFRIQSIFCSSVFLLRSPPTL
jgi:hypothetical protein